RSSTELYTPSLHDALPILIYSGLVGVLATTAMLPWFWQTPSLADAALMASFGWLGYLGHLSLIYALGQAPASTLAPYNYTGFLWALAMGLLLFAEIPDGPTLVGAGVILGAGIYVWHRERVRGQTATG